MTATEMLDYMRGKTHVNDDPLLLQALQAAHSWAFNIVYSSTNGSDNIVSMCEEITPGGTTNSLDLSIDLTYDIAGIKKLWLKLSGETVFTPMIPLDSTDPIFAGMDTIGSSITAADINVSHPLHYYVFNFKQIRCDKVFASTATFRVDYFRYPPPIDPTAHDDLGAGLDLPPVFHQAIIDYAVSEIWDTLDDDRAERRRKIAEISLNDALYVGAARTKGPVRTHPFRPQGRRVI